MPRQNLVKYNFTTLIKNTALFNVLKYFLVISAPFTSVTTTTTPA